MFADEIAEGDFEDPTVHQILLQLNNNVDKQQLTKLTIVSDVHNRKHSYYFISDKTVDV